MYIIGEGIKNISLKKIKGNCPYCPTYIFFEKLFIIIHGVPVCKLFLISIFYHP